MAIPLLCIARIGTPAIILVILFHGLVSPLLFAIVGHTYARSGTRQIVALRGVVLIEPLVSFTCVVRFLYTLGAPPFPSFIAEVSFLSAGFGVGTLTLFRFFIFCAFSLAYNLMWLTSLLFRDADTKLCLTTNLGPLALAAFLLLGSRLALLLLQGRLL